MTFTDTLPKRRYPRVDQCIYCRATDDLTDEHIMPLGLGGNLILPKASCRRCAREIAPMEQMVLRGMHGPLRVALNLKTRRPKQRIEAKVSTPPVCVGFRFPPPAILSGSAETALKGEPFVRYSTADMARLPPGATRIATYNPVEFARVVAKIAYSHAFAEAHSKGESTALNTPLPKLILGDMAEAGKWMGGYHDDAPDTHLHQLRVRTLTSDATGEEFRISIVRLFSLFGMPSYVAVVKTRS